MLNIISFIKKLTFFFNCDIVTEEDLARYRSWAFWRSQTRSRLRHEIPNIEVVLWIAFCRRISILEFLHYPTKGGRPLFLLHNFAKFLKIWLKAIIIIFFEILVKSPHVPSSFTNKGTWCAIYWAMFTLFRTAKVFWCGSGFQMVQNLTL